MRKIRTDINTLLIKLSNVHQDVVELDITTFKTMNEKARFIHKTYGEWWASPTKVIICGQSHPKRKHLTLQDIKQALLVSHNGLVSIDESTFKDTNHKATFIDVDYGCWEANTFKVVKYGAKHPKRSHALHSVHMKDLADNTDFREKVAAGVALKRHDIEQTLLDRYGVRCFFNSPLFKRDSKSYDSIRKIDEEKLYTKIERHKRRRARTDLAKQLRQQLQIKKKISDKWIDIEGTTLKSIWTSTYSSIVSYSKVCKLCKKNTVTTLLELDKLIIDHTKNSDIEHIFASTIGVEKFDKFPVKGANMRPDFKLSDTTYVNVDGLYWHSANCVKNDYHLSLRERANQLGFKIYQFRADEIQFKLDIVKSIVSSKMNSTQRIYARKTKIVDVDTTTAMTFLKDNHLMGKCGATVYLGLEYNNSLSALIALSIKDNKAKVVRFANKLNTTVVGGYSRLLEYAKKKYDLNEIVSFIDLRYGTTKTLEQMGFRLEGITLGWKWTDYKYTYNRLQCRANMDDRRLSEKEHAKELKWYKIYDAGQAKMIWRKPKEG